MENDQLLERISAKIEQLGDAKLQLEQQVNRLKEETASMHLINKELQAQVDELLEKNNELATTRSLKVTSEEDFRGATRQRINELVKEIDDCITLLNQ